MQITLCYLYKCQSMYSKNHSCTKFVLIFYYSTFFSSCFVINMSKMCFEHVILVLSQIVPHSNVQNLTVPSRLPHSLNVQWTLTRELVNMLTAPYFSGNFVILDPVIMILKWFSDLQILVSASYRAARLFSGLHQPDNNISITVFRVSRVSSV